jgi:hypothetical protein
VARAAREKLLWCAGFGLRERWGGALPSTLLDVLQAMEKPQGNSNPLKNDGLVKNLHASWGATKRENT